MALRKDGMYPLLMAKSNREHTDRMLTLEMHLRDSSDVMRYLVEKWVPDRICAVAGLSGNELKRAALFLAGVHDIGKASQSFQTKILKAMPEVRALGLSLCFFRASRRRFAMYLLFHWEAHQLPVSNACFSLSSAFFSIRET